MHIYYLVLLYFCSVCIADSTTTYSSDEPILLDDNFEGTNTLLYKFCLPCDNFVLLNQDIYFKITAKTKAQYIGVDWDSSTPGLNYISYDIDKNQIIIPLYYDRDSTSQWDLDTQPEENIIGFIVSEIEISSVSLHVLGPFTPPTNPSCQQEEPLCDWVDRCGVCHGDDSSCTYPIGCDGLPAKISCDGDNKNTTTWIPGFFTGQVSVVMALLALIPVILASVLFYIFLRKHKEVIRKEDMAEADEMEEQESDDTAPEEFAASPLQV